MGLEADRSARLMRLGIMASGRGSNVRAILEAIAEQRVSAKAAVLICNRESAGVLDVADAFDLPWHVVLRRDHPSRAAQQHRMLELLQTAHVDMVALAGFTAILNPEVVRAFRERILNIHPSLLPAFAGGMAPEPQAAALRAGVKISGCTVHIVTDAVDGGPIVAQAAVPVRRADTVETLSARILEQELHLYPRVLQWFAQDRVRIDATTAHIEPEESQGLWLPAAH